MIDSNKTKDELIAEINLLRQQLDEFKEKADGRALAESALRESEEKFMALAENLPDTIMLFDDKLRHLYVNRKAEEESGIEPARFIGKTHKELGFPEYLVNMWEDALTVTFQTGMPNRIEFELPRGIWIDWLIIPLFDKGGRVSHVITSARDITERKKTEAALKQSEQAVQALLNATTDGVFLVEISGQVLATNESLAARFHKSVKDMVGTVIDTLLPPEVLKKRREHIDCVVKTKQPVRFEDFREGIWLENIFYPLADSNGQVSSIAVFSRNITERKLAEDALRSYAHRVKKMHDIGKAILASDSPEAIAATAVKDLRELICCRIISISVFDHARRIITLLAADADSETELDVGYRIPFDDFELIPDLMSGQPYIANKIETGNLIGKACAQLWGEGAKALALIPLTVKGDLIGSLNLSDRAPDFFTSEHIDIASDIATSLSIVLQQAQEIVRRQKAEEALKISEERYRKLFKDNPLPAVVFDRETFTIIDANDAATEQYGYTGEEFLAMTVKELRPPEEIPALLKGVAMAAENVSKVPFFKHRKKDGTLIDVIVSAHDLDFMDRPYRLVLFTDITERRKTEEQLRLTQFSVEHSAIPTFWLTIAGKPFRVNRAACTSLGYSEDELLSMNVRDWDSNFPYLQWNEISEVLKQKRSLTIESVHTRKDGTTFPVDLTLNYLEFDGKKHLFAFARDVSERKHVEEEKQKLQAQILQTQKMETVGQLAGGIAHDFNNILTAIIGYGHLLQMTAPEETTTRHYAEQIMLSAEKAAQLTQSLLAFSRKQTINPKPQDLKQILKNMEKLLNRLLTEDIEFVTTIPDEPLTIMADITQIDQVLINLSTNARDAMPEGGKLYIIVKSVYLNDQFIRIHGYGTPGKYALLTVSDTGVGMDKEAMTRIFDPFYTTKEVGKGTGLGLSIVYGIIKQHNGLITVYSEPGHGTSFNIYFPLIEMEAHEERAFSLQIVRGTETILVAEDNESVRNLTSTILKDAGYTVIAAVDGLDAIHKFNENADKIDLLVIDVVMPGKNGKEVYEEVKAIRPDVKVLFASGYTRDILVSKGVHDEDFNFIAKPVSPTELLAKLRELLDK